MSFFTKIICAILSAFYVVSSYICLPTDLVYPKKVRLDEISFAVFDDGSFALGFENGKFSIAKDGVTMFGNAVSKAKLGDSMVSSQDYSDFEITCKSISDSRGSGSAVTAEMTADGLPTMITEFTFYTFQKYFLVKTTLVSNDVNDIETNYIAPVCIEDSNIQNGNPKWTDFLEVPFDNDAWAEFETVNLYESGLSHEVGAFFTPDDKDGFIIGSVTHDIWKSAVEYTNGIGTVDTLTVYSGANTALTRDQSPHGKVCGKEVSSAVFLLGFYENWKDGMNEYGRVNTTFCPKRKNAADGTPIGWNSWGAVQSDLSYDIAVSTSDYIKEKLQNTWQDDGGAVYVNLDSYWDNLSTEQLRDFVKHCEENGQIAGAYFSPLVSWHSEEGMKNYCVPGTDVTFNEIRLKKADGTYYGNDIDGCFPLDVTHPATEIYFRNTFEMLKNLGFKYFKLDFLVHGALEGVYYNKDIHTGIQAYNYAMNKVCEILGDDVFINLSMAPIFPYNYANGRRICCDSYYEIKDSKYVLNSLTYGFWESEIYDYIDPDHIVLWGIDGKAKEGEARVRLLSGVVTGGSFLSGDNFVSPAKKPDKAFERYEELLTNKAIIDIAKSGEPFEGHISKKSEYAAEVFTLEKDGKNYIALFNYGILPKTFKVELPFENCSVKNLFTGKTDIKKKTTMLVTVPASDAVIFEVTK